MGRSLSTFLILTVALLASATPQRTIHRAKPLIVQPHFSLMAEAFTAPKALAALELDNPKGVKTLTEIIPVYDVDWENGDGETSSYEFDSEGRLIAFTSDYRDAAGGLRYTVEYNASGNPSRIIHSEMNATQDQCTSDENLWYTATYTIDYTNGRPAHITETTTKLGRRKADATFHYSVSYSPDGAITVRCDEQPSVFVSFNPDLTPAKYSKYRFGCGDGPDWSKTGFTLEEVDLSEFSYEAEKIPSPARVTYDTHGNWIKKEWTSDGYSDGLRRHISYF